MNRRIGIALIVCSVLALGCSREVVVPPAAIRSSPGRVLEAAAIQDGSSSMIGATSDPYWYVRIRPSGTGGRDWITVFAARRTYPIGIAWLRDDRLAIEYDDEAYVAEAAITNWVKLSNGKVIQLQVVLRPVPSADRGRAR